MAHRTLAVLTCIQHTKGTLPLRQGHSCHQSAVTVQMRGQARPIRRRLAPLSLPASAMEPRAAAATAGLRGALRLRCAAPPPRFHHGDRSILAVNAVQIANEQQDIYFFVPERGLATRGGAVF